MKLLDYEFVSDLPEEITAKIKIINILIKILLATLF